MAVTLDLEPDVEERLREKAAEKGLSVEGYLLTLIETLMREPETTARSKRPAFRRGLRLRPQKRDRMENLQEQGADLLVAQAAQEMRAKLAGQREQAVEAAAQMNFLRGIVERQERLLVETEIKALRALRDDDRDLARQCFQEMTVMEVHLSVVKPHLLAVSEAADALMEAFKKEEDRIRGRLTRAQAQALEANEKFILTKDRIRQQIGRTSAEQWDRAFEQWIEDCTHGTASRLDTWIQK